MRTRTDTRRQQILEQAAAVFRDEGYERASMAQIAARVGGSKTTLYGYFKSKQELFANVMIDAMEAQSEALIALIDPLADDPRPALAKFGKAYLDLILSSEIIEVTRIGVAEGDNNGIGRKLYELGQKRGWSAVSGQLEGWISRGLLRHASTAIMALHLQALLGAGLVEPALYGAAAEIDRDEALERAVDAFLLLYGTGMRHGVAPS